MKVNSSSSPEGVGGRWSCTLAGNGGTLSENLPGTGGGRGCSNRESYGEAVGLGGTGGGAAGIPDDLYICSFGGRAGAVLLGWESVHACCIVL